MNKKKCHIKTFDQSGSRTPDLRVLARRSNQLSYRDNDCKADYLVALYATVYPRKTLAFVDRELPFLS